MRKLAAALAAVLAVPLAARAGDVQALFEKKCASCHGKDGKGDTTMGKRLGVRAFALARGKSDADLEKSLREGVPGTKMPAFQDKMSDAEAKDLVKLVRGLMK
jgi:cytochrome c oxidase cbb3-type subunit 2/cytochrome c oxidase cbb3-type subunit I/II